MSIGSGDGRTRGIAAGAITAGVALGDVVLQPLMMMRAATVVPLALAVLALWRTRRESWRGAVPAAFLALVGVTLVSVPIAWWRAPVPDEGRIEVQGLLAGVAIALAVVALARGDDTARRLLDRAWPFALAASLTVVAGS